MTAPSTTEHDRGVPTWPRWRMLYALWNSAADWRTRRSIIAGAVKRLLARAH